MSYNLTMIKYNNKNICILPIFPKMKKLLLEYYKDNKNKKIKANSLYIMAGINYIPTEYWEKCKEHHMVQLLIEDKVIEEIENKNSKMKIEKKKIETKKINIVEQKKERENQIKKLKDQIEKGNPQQKKEKEKTVKKLEKEIQNLNEEEIVTKEELQKIKENFNSYQSMEKRQKEEIIKETFDIRSLEKIMKEEKDSDIRHTIQLRIDKVLNAKTDVTIGHPESHLKTSGK